MDTTQFLSQVLGGTGRLCTFAAGGPDGAISQQFHDSVDELIDVAHDRDRDGYDTYYALATFGEANTRKAHNVQQIRCFFLDLDCGEGKDYPDQCSAVKALRTFVEELSLPKPVLVSSGYGVHVYWLLTEAVSAHEWLPVADQLKHTCKVRGLRADPSVTADIARVLRIPGTHNHKYGLTAPVVLFGSAPAFAPVGIEAFSALLDPAPVQAKPLAQVEGGDALLSRLIGNTDNSFRAIVNKTKQGKGCEQLKIIATQQETVSEPLWRAGLSIAKFCVEGQQAAHAISKNHPGYDPETTNDKLEGIKGPYLCEKFDEFNPGICEKCVNWGKIKSPVVLGKHVAEAEPDADSWVVGKPDSDPNAPLQTYVIPPYPKPYFRGRNGGVYVRSKTDDGETDEKLVYLNDLYVVSRLDDPEYGEGVVVRLHLPKDGVREFTLPLRVAMSRDEFRRLMASKGVAVLNMDEIMAYITRWVNELQATNAADKARRQFGWTDEACSSFVLGDREYFPDRIQHNAPSSHTAGLIDYMAPRGTLEGWKGVMEFYNRDGFELHQYIALTGIASVLMQTATVNALAMHVWSKESGLGKTTAMMVGASAWGKPKALILNREDTLNAKMLRGEVYHNLPLYLDEITNMPPIEMSNLAYQFTGGHQKLRMRQSANEERYRGEEWKLLAVSTGNTSFHERVSRAKVMAKAEAQRVLEVRADRLFDATSEKFSTDEFSAEIHRHYGHGGPLFVQHYMNHKAEIDALVLKVQKRIDMAAGLTSENRFWSEGPPRVVVAAMILKRMGLINYSVERLFKWSVQMLIDNKKMSSDMSLGCKELITNYIMEHWGSFIWIRSTEDGRSVNNNGLDQLVVPEQNPRQQLRGRYETDTKKLYLVPMPLKRWCADNQISYASLNEDLMTEMKGIRIRARIAKGTNFKFPSTEVLVIYMDADLDELIPTDAQASTGAG